MGLRFIDFFIRDTLNIIGVEDDNNKKRDIDYIWNDFREFGNEDLVSRLLNQHTEFFALICWSNNALVATVVSKNNNNHKIVEKNVMLWNYEF